MFKEFLQSRALPDLFSFGREMPVLERIGDFAGELEGFAWGSTIESLEADGLPYTLSNGLLTLLNRHEPIEKQKPK